MHVVDGRNRRVAREMVRSFPNLLLANEREMFLSSPSVFVPQLRSQHFLFSGGDVVSVVQTAAGTALVYGVLSAGRQAWAPALLSFGVFLYSLLGPLANAFPASNHVNSEARAIDRCLARLGRKGGAGKRIAPELSQDLDTCYWRTLNKLHSLSAVMVQDLGKAQPPRREEQVSPARQPRQETEVPLS
jgi:hypothetical protein